VKVRSLLVVAALSVSACTKSPPGLQSMDGAAVDALGPDAGPQIATVAGNGVPIPPPDQKDDCGGLGLEIGACTAGISCPPVACDCPIGSVQVFGSFACTSSGCVTSVSCPVACDVGFNVLETAIVCWTAGLCANDGDCATGQTCLKTPGQSRGSCGSRGERASCLVDADCDSGACVIESPSRRYCSPRAENAKCNRDSHCASGRCLFDAGKYVGVCADGTNGDLCFHAGDCKPGLRCLGNDVEQQCSDGGNESLCNTVDDCQPDYSCIPVDFTLTGHQCSSGTKGARCTVDAQCSNNGFCVMDSFDKGTCNDGAVGAPCRSGSQCKSGFCGLGEGKCTTGDPGSSCYYDQDCLSGKCDGEPGTGVQPHCTDGKLGHSCRQNAQCEAGLRCSAPLRGVCEPALPKGGQCWRDDDCQSGRCAADPAGSPLLYCT
jgi:hypothetical protein